MFRQPEFNPSLRDCVAGVAISSFNLPFSVAGRLPRVALRLARNDSVFKVSGSLKLYRSSFCPCRKTVIATTAHAGVRGNLKKVHVIAKFALANCGNLLVV